LDLVFIVAVLASTNPLPVNYDAFSCMLCLVFTFPSSLLQVDGSRAWIGQV